MKRINLRRGAFVIDLQHWEKSLYIGNNRNGLGSIGKAFCGKRI